MLRLQPTATGPAHRQLGQLHKGVSPTVRRPQTALAGGRGGRTPQAAASSYVCVDCGYIYTDKKKDFSELPGSWRCPACAASKNRFKPFKTSSKSNDNKSMATRVAALRKELADNGEEVGEDLSFLILTGASAAVILGAAYFFTMGK